MKGYSQNKNSNKSLNVVSSIPFSGKYKGESVGLSQNFDEQVRAMCESFNDSLDVGRKVQKETERVVGPIAHVRRVRGKLPHPDWMMTMDQASLHAARIGHSISQPIPAAASLEQLWSIPSVHVHQSQKITTAEFPQSTDQAVKLAAQAKAPNKAKRPKSAHAVIRSGYSPPVPSCQPPQLKPRFVKKKIQPASEKTLFNGFISQSQMPSPASPGSTYDDEPSSPQYDSEKGSPNRKSVLWDDMNKIKDTSDDEGLHLGFSAVEEQQDQQWRPIIATQRLLDATKRPNSAPARRKQLITKESGTSVDTGDLSLGEMIQELRILREGRPKIDSAKFLLQRKKKLYDEQRAFSEAVAEEIRAFNYKVFMSVEQANKWCQELGIPREFEHIKKGHKSLVVIKDSTTLTNRETSQEMFMREYERLEAAHERLKRKTDEKEALERFGVNAREDLLKDFGGLGRVTQRSLGSSVSRSQVDEYTVNVLRKPLTGSSSETIRHKKQAQSEIKKELKEVIQDTIKLTLQLETQISDIEKRGWNKSVASTGSLS